jgi:hypothetical protein
MQWVSQVSDHISSPVPILARSLEFWESVANQIGLCDNPMPGRRGKWTEFLNVRSSTVSIQSWLTHYECLILQNWAIQTCGNRGSLKDPLGLYSYKSINVVIVVTTSRVGKGACQRWPQTSQASVFAERVHFFTAFPGMVSSFHTPSPALRSKIFNLSASVGPVTTLRNKIFNLSALCGSRNCRNDVRTDASIYVVCPLARDEGSLQASPCEQMRPGRCRHLRVLPLRVVSWFTSASGTWAKHRGRFFCMVAAVDLFEVSVLKSAQIYRQQKCGVHRNLTGRERLNM